MLTNVHCMLVPISRAWLVDLSGMLLVWAASNADIFHFRIIYLLLRYPNYTHIVLYTLYISNKN